MKIINVADIDANSLTISLFNKRSLRRHALDLKEIKHLTGNDILYLKESQISIDRVVTDIVNELNTFQIYFYFMWREISQPCIFYAEKLSCLKS